MLLFVLAGALVASLAGAVVPVAGTNSEESFLHNGRTLTFEGRRSGEGYFSPDGRYIIFQSERDADNPFYQMYVLDLQTGDTQRVSPGYGKTTCGFFQAGGERVLFASTHLDPDARDKQQQELDFRASGKERRYSWDYDETFEIFSATVDGDDTQQLTNVVGYDAEGAFSPDGRHIVFCSTRAAYPTSNLSAEDRKRLEMDPSYFGEIYIMKSDGSDVVQLTEWPGYDGGPFFTPDGEGIVWRHFDESGLIADVYTMRLDGSQRQQLTDFASMCWAPYFHPSGDYAIFTTNKLGFENFELYVVDGAGRREPVRVTYTDGFDGLPAFSPDGRRIVWTSNRTSSGQSQLFIADWDHNAALAAVAASPARGGVSAAPTDILLRTHVDYLASDELEGRMTGSDGERSAADYIAGRLKDIGIDGAEDGDYFQPFPFTAGIEVIDADNDLSVTGNNGDSRRYEVNEDFRPLPFTTNEQVQGELVFAGYGLSAPGEMGVGYDSYGELDVAGKVVLVLRYVPEEVEVERRAQLNRYAGLRYKALIARERGAKALLVVTGPNSPNAGELASMRFDRSQDNSGILVATISGDVAEQMFAQSGKSLEEVQAQLDIENPHFEGAFALPGVSVDIQAAVKRDMATGQNVVAMLPPYDSSTSEYVIIGAHYDHIGHGVIGSLAKKGEEGMIHNGADDNASGTAVVLEVASQMAKLREDHPEKFQRGVIVALWSGEEIGLIGSSYFAEHPVVDFESIVAYVNFDMVGRMRDNTLVLQGVASSDAWRPIIEKRNVVAGFDLKLQDDPYLPTDATAFYTKGVPIISFFTGSHEDYNRPTDDAETLDYDGMERIVDLATLMVTDLVTQPQPPQYAKVDASKSRDAGRGSLRAYLGTIPDYAGEGSEGVKLSGVREGGPADEAGVLGGDIIVELAGQKVTNIYDYTFALDAVKIGVTVDIVVVRDGERIKLSITPQARE